MIIFSFIKQLIMNVLFPKKKVNINAIKTINPYKLFYGKGPLDYSWVFDDANVGLDKEALVAGADEICDGIAQQLGKDKFAIQFSEFKFPSAKFHGDYKAGDIKGGTTFYSPELHQEFWLCPALGHYFTDTPKQLWVDFK